MIYAGKTVHFKQRTPKGHEIRSARIVRMIRDRTGTPAWFVVCLKLPGVTAFTGPLQYLHRNCLNTPALGCGIYTHGQIFSV